ncbi:fumarylacetoacetate hydrolase family protein [Streptomyces sp. S1D4-11]|nr:fumarylacetoacetate hydrolase family protein [Streptomyces sp. S1D4-11]QIZ00741.1 fumarylacetoacetate hydrolase family protein [Streptomyces sp. S1D4-11]
MRLLRFGPAGSERPAAQLNTGVTLDLSPITSDIDSSFLSDWPRHRHTILSGRLEEIDIGSERIGPPVATPGAVYGIGLNYASHAEETAMELPPDPLVFMVAPSSITGPHDDIVLPPGSTAGDWEVELGVVIGRRAHLLDSPEAAREVVFGYVAANDVSERRWQMERGGQWTKGKSFPTAHPIGPYLVTADELEPDAELDLILTVNGESRQYGNTRDMIFPVDHIIWHLTQFTELRPGDLILTGTPHGVGFGRKPAVFLRDGDVIDLEVQEVGLQRNVVRIPPARH